MSEHDLIGLASRDLDEGELRARDALLQTDPEARADAEFAEELRALLDEDLPGGPSLQEVRGRRGANRRWAIRATLVLAASALIWVGFPGGEDGVRDRGAGAAGAAVRLSAIAEGPDGLRELGPGAAVHPDEQVVFWIETSADGTVRLVEDGNPVYPGPGETWRVEAGSRALGGISPLAWRADSPGRHRYTAELCPTQDSCVRTELTLEWAPR